ncbi:MAG: Na(+)-translocating NADH-quinone reductase subunit A [Candidatus Omnitrophica bacterium]|nr:Na(+)-translocating NADH-quinone reductase subunit A [Candidatus Omnitrophota bacterium]
MAEFLIKKGRDIRLKGAAKKDIVAASFPKHVAVQPPDFRGLNLRLEVDVGDSVKVGTALLSDKADPRIGIASPASGKVTAINRGEKRALLSVVIETDGRQEAIRLQPFSEQQLQDLSRQDVIDFLLKGNLWPAIRQRPFSKISNPQETPKSVFIHAMNTEPLALDIDFVLQNKENEFQAGLMVLKKLTDGEVHLCIQEGAQSKALTQAKGVQTHSFAGPHPAGNVSTHIHYVDPIKKGDLVWYVEAQDVLRIAALFLKGVYPVERIVAVTGEGAAGHQVYAKTILGAPLAALVDGERNERMRYLSGSVLTGKDVGAQGFLRRYDTQVTVLPAGGKREFLGWLSPGLKKYTFSKTFLSAFHPAREVSLDTDEHGSHRAMVLNNVYDPLVPLDVMTDFLLKAVLAGNVEEAEELGILECDEEDFALCTFACPSKTDVGGIVRQGLDLAEKEG